MKLRDVMLCLNLECEEVFEHFGAYRFDGADYAACPACGGNSARLSRWIPTMNEYTKYEVSKTTAGPWRKDDSTSG